MVAAQRLDAAMLGLAGLVGSLVAEHALREPGNGRRVEPLSMIAARRFVEEHLDEPIALVAVAREATLSRFHFCRVFKQWSGLTLTEYVTRRRLQKALALLADPGKRITEIALAAGFGSMARFYCAFKRETGLSPIEYRQRERCGAPRP